MGAAVRTANAVDGVQKPEHHHEHSGHQPSHTRDYPLFWVARVVGVAIQDEVDTAAESTRDARMAELSIAGTLTPEALRTRREGILVDLARRADRRPDGRARSASTIVSTMSATGGVSCAASDN